MYDWKCKLKWIWLISNEWKLSWKSWMFERFYGTIKCYSIILQFKYEVSYGLVSPQTNVLWEITYRLSLIALAHHVLNVHKPCMLMLYTLYPSSVWLRSSYTFWKCIVQSCILWTFRPSSRIGIPVLFNLFHSCLAWRMSIHSALAVQNSPIELRIQALEHVLSSVPSIFAVICSKYWPCLFQLMTDFEGSILRNPKVRWLP